MSKLPASWVGWDIVRAEICYKCLSLILSNAEHNFFFVFFISLFFHSIQKLGRIIVEGGLILDKYCNINLLPIPFAPLLSIKN